MLEVPTVKQGRQGEVLTWKQFPIFLKTKMTISNICQRCHRTNSRLNSGAVQCLHQELQDYWANPKHNRFDRLNPGDIAILAHGKLVRVKDRYHALHAFW